MIRLLLVSGEAKVVSNLSRTLGQHQINTSKFCIKFNEESLKVTLPNILYYVYIEKREGRDNYVFNLGSPSLKFLINELSSIGHISNNTLNLEQLFDLYSVYKKLTISQSLNSKEKDLKIFLGMLSSINYLKYNV